MVIRVLYMSLAISTLILALINVTFHVGTQAVPYASIPVVLLVVAAGTERWVTSRRGGAKRDVS